MFPFGNKCALALGGLAPPRLPAGYLHHCLPLFSITRLIHLSLVVKTMLRIHCAELHGSGIFHSYLNREKQAAGWEESWTEELCGNKMLCLARLPLQDGVEGLSWEFLENEM